MLLDLARGGLLEKLTDAPAGNVAAANATATPDPEPPADPALTARAGCFVSLHERITHRLRGCVGRLDPDLPLWQVVRVTAGEVLRDPRFASMPVMADEIALLELEVSVLSPPREAAGPLDFEVTDGIYLIFGSRSGFFLPQVARETGWTKEQLLNRLCEEKLGMDQHAWRKPDAKLFTFKVEVIGPEPLRACDAR
ncbi:MAG: uncharacterized protein QOE14_899 [Humisphaera sp.]|nr:uncharacterized protein [Humisphaera sp.]